MSADSTSAFGWYKSPTSIRYYTKGPLAQSLSVLHVASVTDRRVTLLLCSSVCCLVMDLQARASRRIQEENFDNFIPRAFARI